MPTFDSKPQNTDTNSPQPSSATLIAGTKIYELYRQISKSGGSAPGFSITMGPIKTGNDITAGHYGTMSFFGTNYAYRINFQESDVEEGFEGQYVCKPDIERLPINPLHIGASPAITASEFFKDKSNPEKIQITETTIQELLDDIKNPEG